MMNWFTLFLTSGYMYIVEIVVGNCGIFIHVAC